MDMEVKIDKLSHDFKGIVKVDGKVTFVNGALPLENVDIVITESKKKMNKGRVLSFKTTSEDRIRAKCPYYDKCGGCDTGHIVYEKVIQYKKEIFSDIMKRYANMEVNPDMVYDNNIWGYRNKIRLRVHEGKPTLYLEDTHDFVNISSCLLVNEKINGIMKILNNNDLNGATDIVIRGEDEIMVSLNGNISEKKVTDMLGGKVSAIILNNRLIYGNEYIRIKVGDIVYAIYPESFFQVNTRMISKLYDKVREYAGRGDRLLDLYCGAGTIGIYLANNFKEVLGVEINSDAIHGAKLNKEINGVSNISFKLANARSISDMNFDVIVVDPPRSGLDKVTLDKLLKSGAKRIVYVSCNPITFARDINVLKDNYMVFDITLFDMFPNTKHMESVCMLNRK